MITLSTNTSSLLMQGDNPEIIYFGEKLNQAMPSDDVAALVESPLAQAGFDQRSTIKLLSTYASSSLLNPAIKVHRAGRHWALQWDDIEIKQSDQSITLCFVDKRAQLSVSMTISADADSNVFSLSGSVKNLSDEPLEVVQWLHTLPLDSGFNVARSFGGRWVKEFSPSDHELPIGTLEFTNIKGRTSQDHFPGLLVAPNTFQNDTGAVISFHLAWSGNHTQRVERNQLGLTQYQAGIELMPGEILLAGNEEYENATLYFTYSHTGLAGIARNFQTFVRQNVLTWPEDKPRPVHINTWEAMYFDHQQSELDKLAVAAKKVGIERFVLDDGWFKGRRSDNAGLGDWEVDKTIYKDGLAPLAKTLAEQTLEMGLWFEPEMVNHDSDLYRAHPDWVLQVEGVEQVSGRNQWVLDLSRAEVRDSLFTQISKVLKEYPIRYIKWDMNRDLLQAGNQTGQASYYRYVQGLYCLIDQVRAAHPSVEIESCSSGGGRMDFAILRRTHRFWLSDCNDSLERQRMQQWASLFFPAEVLGSHIGPPTSHTTSRTQPLYVRAGTALFCHLGVEWDIRSLSQEESSELSHYIALHTSIRQHLHHGVRIPLTCPDASQIGFLVQDSGKAWVSVFQEKMPELSVPGYLKISALDEQRLYRVNVLIAPPKTHHLMKQKPTWMIKNTPVSGEWLRKKGMPLPVMDPETLLVLEIETV